MSDGIARHMLFAKRMVHYPDDDSTDLEDPYFIETAARQASHAGEIGQAKDRKHNEDIYLMGNVMVIRNGARAAVKPP